MQLISRILPQYFVRDRHIFWVGAVRPSSCPPQTPAVENPIAVLRKQRAHQLPPVHVWAAPFPAGWAQHPGMHRPHAADRDALSTLESLPWLLFAAPSPGSCTVPHPTPLSRSPGAGWRPSALNPRAAGNEVWSLLPGAMCEPVTWL